VIDRPSPNHDARPAGKATDLIVLHYTGMPAAESALERLTDPAAKVSSHYLIDEQGAVHRLVAESRRAWHAGVSCWAGERDVNGISIGIELANPGHDFGYRPFPKSQMAALVELCRGIVRRHPVPRARVVGHSDVAPRRKIDPGELFDWQGLAAAGFGLWPEPIEGPGNVASVLQALVLIGYEVGAGPTDEITHAAIAAFQRHFRPRRIDGALDVETKRLICGLAQAAREART
jgi:N-acetylmuramoyl-L-alanine amidase